ncbi:unnamed protein product [Rhizophagus irregularis]|nr:unnamed protein product [Rhizophagus irregularis]
MSRARTSGDIWWARIFDRLDEFLHNYPKLPKNSVTESSLPLHIGSKVTINNYNTFLHNYGSIDGQVLHYVPRGNGVEVAPDACVSPGVAFVPKPSASAVIPRPPGNTCGNPHARIMCENNDGQTLPSRNANSTSRLTSSNTLKWDCPFLFSEIFFIALGGYRQNSKKSYGCEPHDFITKVAERSL